MRRRTRYSTGHSAIWLSGSTKGSPSLKTDLAQPGTNVSEVDLFCVEDLAGGWTPDLARLESLNDIRQMTPRIIARRGHRSVSFLNDSRSEKDVLLASLAAVNEPPASGDWTAKERRTSG